MFEISMQLKNRMSFIKVSRDKKQKEQHIIMLLELGYLRVCGHGANELMKRQKRQHL